MTSVRAGGRAIDLLLGLSLLAAVALRAWWLGESNVAGPDLNPRPDALEYALAAESFVRGEGFTLDLEGVSYPTRYPPGFALVAAPFVAAFGVDRAWWASLTMSSLTILLCAALGRIAGGRIGFVVAGAVALLSPAMLTSSRLAMSETTTQFCVAVALLGAMALHWRADQPRRALFIASSLVAAFAVIVRYTNLAFVLPLAVLALRRGHDGLQAPRRFALAAIPIALALAALVALGARNHMVFGSAFHDGYRFWVPELYASGLTFSLGYLWKPLADLFPSGNLAAYAPQLLGTAANLWTWPIAALALVGIARAVALRRSCPCAETLFVTAIFAAPAIIAFYSVYAWQDPRFLEPLIPLIAALAAFGAAAIAARFGNVVANGLGLAALAHLGFVAYPNLRAFESAVDHPPLLRFLERGVKTLDSAAMRPDLAIIDFDPALARRALAEGAALIVADLESAAPHFARVLDRDLRASDGRRAAIRALARRGAVVDSEIEAVRGAVLAGATVFYLEAAREGDPGVGIARLRDEFEFVEQRMAPGEWLFEAWVPPVRAFALRKR